MPTDPGTDAENLTLRLVDLSRAYRLGNDGYCQEGFYYEEGLDPRLFQVDLMHPSYTCEIDFRDRGYALWGRPEEIVSKVTVFGSLDSALMAFDAVVDVDGGRLKRTPAQPIGDASAFYTTQSPHAAGQAAMLWRTGRVLSSITADGQSKRWVDRHVLRLARVQQARITSPTTLAPSDNSRRSIPTIDPTIQAPTYWLGLTFHGPQLPDRRLDYIEQGTPCCGPDWIATADYSYISLGTWAHQNWKNFRQSRVGKLVFQGDPCGRTTRFQLRDRQAVVISRRVMPDLSWYPETRPYQKQKLKRYFTERWKDCRTKWSRIHFAYVRFRDAVVSINVPQCRRCIGGTLDRYDSPAGMRAIAEGLRLRRPTP